MRVRHAIFASVAAAVFAAASGGAWYVHSLGTVPSLNAADTSTQVVDRHGKLLRPYATADGRWRLPAKVADVDARCRCDNGLQTYEDRRFSHHAGVDLMAMGRAAWQFVTNGHVISGGSTLTMQVARLLEPRTEAYALGAKLTPDRSRRRDRARTHEQEMMLLGLYRLSLAPYGGNPGRHPRLASLAYFGREPKKLSRSRRRRLLVALPPIARGAPAGPLGAAVARAASTASSTAYIARSGRKIVPPDENRITPSRTAVAAGRPSDAPRSHRMRPIRRWPAHLPNGAKLHRG